MELASAPEKWLPWRQPRFHSTMPGYSPSQLHEGALGVSWGQRQAHASISELHAAPLQLPPRMPAGALPWGIAKHEGAEREVLRAILGQIMDF